MPRTATMMPMNVKIASLDQFDEAEIDGIGLPGVVGDGGLGTGVARAVRLYTSAIRGSKRMPDRSNVSSNMLVEDSRGYQKINLVDN
jgi:hypothetical protein